jgi:hypothetical protein
MAQTVVFLERAHFVRGLFFQDMSRWAAEWVMMMRNMFVREENGGLVLASGVLEEWLDAGQPLSFGPRPGHTAPRIQPSREVGTVSWEAVWRREPAFISVALAGQPPRHARGVDRSAVAVSRRGLKCSVGRT